MFITLGNFMLIKPFPFVNNNDVGLAILLCVISIKLKWLLGYGSSESYILLGFTKYFYSKNVTCKNSLSVYSTISS